MYTGITGNWNLNSLNSSKYTRYISYDSNRSFLVFWVPYFIPSLLLKFEYAVIPMMHKCLARSKREIALLTTSDLFEIGVKLSLWQYAVCIDITTRLYEAISPRKAIGFFDSLQFITSVIDRKSCYYGPFEK